MELRKMSIDEYKQVIKNMLGDVHKFCMEHNIRYFIAYGSLIGAIRHNGFIPWDDDIDIWMDGEDYDRFVEEFSKDDSKYYILSPENSPTYYNLMTRICSKAGTLKMKGVENVENLGPFIDVFPIYKAPNDHDSRMAFFEEIKKSNLDVRYSLPFRLFKTVPLKKRIPMYYHCLRRFGKRYFVGTEKLKERRKTLLRKYENTDSDWYYSVFEVKVSDRRIFTLEEKTNVELHKFEDIEVLIPSAYDTILTRLYGDYMTPPPEEKRVTRHHFTPYWIE